MENFWQGCLERFGQELSTQQFNTWIRPIQFKAENGSIQLIVPNRFVQQWVKEKFMNRIEQLATEYFSEPIAISLELSAAVVQAQIKSPLAESIDKQPLELIKRKKKFR